MWNGEFIEKDRRIYPFRACKCWACNYPYNRGVVSKLEPLKWFNSAWIGRGICEDVYTWGVVEWVFNHSVLEPGNSREVHVEHWSATRYSLLISDCSFWLGSTLCLGVFDFWIGNIVLLHWLTSLLLLILYNHLNIGFPMLKLIWFLQCGININITV